MATLAAPAASSTEEDLAPIRPRRRGALAGPAVGAGVVLALSIPPWGFWVLAPLGFAVLYLRLDGLGGRERLLTGWLAGFVLYGMTLWWMAEFSLPGSFLVFALEGLFVGLAALATPPVRWRAAAFPAAVVAAEASRGVWPFGGLPLGGVSLGQVSGPLAPTARLGSGLALAGLAALAGVALAQFLRPAPSRAEAARRLGVAAAAAAVVAASVGLAAVVPDGDGGPGERLTVAAVQGGGPRGFRRVETDVGDVFDRHYEASRALEAGDADLVVWPEDVVDVEGPVTENDEADRLAALARRVDAPLVVGVVEGDGDRFRNAAVALGADGAVIDRYEKVRRVPYGEYVPGRALIDKVADLSAIPRDAVPGRGPGRLDVPGAHLGVLISYEVFFNDRSRKAVDAGAELLLVPTNAASYTTSQVPTQQLAAARLRALETGRWLVQAGPTGYSAVIAPDGRLVARTVLGARDVLRQVVALRTGRTPFSRWGEAPVLVLAGLALLAAWGRTNLTD